MVVHAFRRQRVVAVPFDFIAHRTDHLAVAGITTLTDIDVPPYCLQRRIGTHAFDLLDGVFQVEQRHDFHDPADCYDQQRQNEEKRRVGFDEAVFG